MLSILRKTSLLTSLDRNNTRSDCVLLKQLTASGGLLADFSEFDSNSCRVQAQRDANLRGPTSGTHGKRGLEKRSNLNNRAIGKNYSMI